MNPSIELLGQDWPIDSYAIANPGNPATDNMRLFTRTNGNSLELVSRGPLGDECILCSKQNVVAVPKLYLNWVA